MKRGFRWSVLVLAGLATRAGAQSRPATPEDVVRDFFKAEQDGRWLDAARMLDLNQFESIRRSSISENRAWRAPRLITAEEMMKHEPEMPRAAAEYQVKRMKESYSTFDPLSRDFARVPSIDSLRALPVDAAAARWLEARSPGWRIELGRRESTRNPESKCPELPDSLKAAIVRETGTPSPRILGIASGSDSVSYAVIGAALESRKSDPSEPQWRGDFNSPSTLTLRKVSGIWKIVPASDMPNLEGLNGMFVSYAVWTCTPQSPPK